MTREEQEGAVYLLGTRGTGRHKKFQDDYEGHSFDSYFFISFPATFYKISMSFRGNSALNSKGKWGLPDPTGDSQVRATFASELP